MLKPYVTCIKLIEDNTGHYFVVQKVFTNEDQDLWKREDMVILYYYKENKYNGATFPVQLMSKELALKTAEEISKSLSREFGIMDLGLM